MEVAARLSDHLLAHLRVVLAARDHTLVPVRGWDDLAPTLRHRAVDVIVLEPAPLAAGELGPLLDLLATHPGTPVVVYTVVNAPAMAATMELARAGARHVVLKGFDDSPRRFRALLEDLADEAWVSALAPWATARVANTPEPVARAVDRLFRFPHRFHDVRDLVRAAGTTRRTLERWLLRAGIRSAKLLVLSARVERAHYLLRHSAAPLGEVATRLGYPSTRLLARQIRLVTQRTATGVRQRVGTDELVAHLADRLSVPRPPEPEREPAARARRAPAGDPAEMSVR